MAHSTGLHIPLFIIVTEIILMMQVKIYKWKLGQKNTECVTVCGVKISLFAFPYK